ncbi:hypothetical protein NL676_029960 [Syzygium grande]|nr:hypothetical protein NL676_029960 [Syzygium grande]
MDHSWPSIAPVYRSFMAEGHACASCPWIVHDRLLHSCIVPVDRSWPTIAPVHHSFMAEGHANASGSWIVHGRASHPCIVYSWPRVAPMHRARASFMAVHRARASWPSAWDMVDDCGRVHRSWPSLVAECIGHVRGSSPSALVLYEAHRTNRYFTDHFSSN